MKCEGSNVYLLGVYILISLHLPTIKGYLYFVKSSSRGGSICYTNETSRAVAFIQHLDSKFMPLNNTRTSYNAILDDSNFRGTDCIMSNRCHGWDTQDFEEMSSNEDENFPPVLDRRWNSLPVTTLYRPHQYTSLVPLTYPQGVIHISILARHTTQLLFAPQNNLVEGKTLSLVLDALENGTYGRSGLRYCPFTSFANQYGGINDSCRYLVEMDDEISLLKNGSNWLHVTMYYKMSMSSFSLRVLANKKMILNVVNTMSLSQSNQPCWLISVPSLDGSQALYKLHSYDVLRPIKKDAVLQTAFEILRQQTPLCMDIVYFLKPNDEPRTKNITVEIKPLDKQGGYTKIVITKHPDYEWKNHRLQTTPLQTGFYGITVVFSSDSFFIGDIHFCTKEKVVVTTRYGDATACKFLEGVTNGNISRNSSGLNREETLAICKRLKRKNCKGVEYCAQSQCECFPPYQRGEKSQKCELLSALADNYNKNLAEFDVTVKVTDIQIFSCEVDISDVLQKLQLKYRGNFSLIQFIQVQIFREEVWSAVKNLSIGQVSYVLQNLQPGQNYAVRAIVVGNGSQKTLEITKVVNFTTQACIKADKENTRVSIDRSLRVRVSFDETVRPMLCKISKVEVKILKNAFYLFSASLSSIEKDVLLTTNSKNDEIYLIFFYDNGINTVEKVENYFHRNDTPLLGHLGVSTEKNSAQEEILYFIMNGFILLLTASLGIICTIMQTKVPRTNLQ